MKCELEDILSNAVDNGYITEKERNFLFNNNPTISCFYMLAKVHKCDSKPPGRGIISGNGSLSEPVSQYIDHFIKPFASSLPSFIQDTTHVLRKI